MGDVVVMENPRLAQKLGGEGGSSVLLSEPPLPGRLTRPTVNSIEQVFAKLKAMLRRLRLRKR